jgi:hypothetical protein
MQYQKINSIKKFKLLGEYQDMIYIIL